MPAWREFSGRRRAVIAASPDFRERDALKGLGLTASMTDALKRRGMSDLISCMAADMGALTLRIACERWSDATNGDEFSDVARRTLRELCKLLHPCVDSDAVLLSSSTLRTR
jgi:hypothetical protein